MLASIARIVEQFKQSWSEELEDEAIHAACQEAGHRGRDRKLDPVTTVRLFLLQIRCGNAACNHVPRLAGMKLTGSASCEARGRLPLEVLQTLLTRCTSQMSECVRETGRWRGQRLFMTDGSSFSMPDTEELREHFGQPGGQKKGCGFPTAHWLALVHFGSGLMQKVLATPLRSHDLAGVAPLHAELEADDVLLGDRAFCSFAHLALLLAGGMHAIVRAHQRLIVNFMPGRAYAPPVGGKSAGKKGQPRSRWIKKLGFQDQIVEWFKGPDKPAWMSVETWTALPPSFVVRELRYRMARPGFRIREVTLVTTLLDAERYTKNDLAEAYHLRWNIELQFRALKQTFGRGKPRSRTSANAVVELDWSLVGLWLIQLFAVKEQIKVDSPPEQSSVALALNVVQDAMRNWSSAIRAPRELARRLSQATKDGYQRAGPKQSRYLANYKDKPCATKPIVVQASHTQRQAYQALSAAA